MSCLIFHSQMVDFALYRRSKRVAISAPAATSCLKGSLFQHGARCARDAAIGIGLSTQAVKNALARADAGAEWPVFGIQETPPKRRIRKKGIDGRIRFC
jgi:hypothetical protein